MIVVAIAVVVVVPPLLVAWSLCRAAAYGDDMFADLDDVRCPRCGSSDVYDFEDDWWACHGCQMMFESTETR
jgi:ribosomal protein S27AE